MTKRLAATVSLLLAGLVLLASGCGGSSRLSETAFRLRVQHICRLASRQLGATLGPDIRLNTRADLHVLVRHSRSAESKLSRVNPPLRAEPLYRDLVTRATRVTAFVSANEAKEWSFISKAPHLGLLGLRRFLRFRGATVEDSVMVHKDARGLKLGACDALVAQI